MIPILYESNETQFTSNGLGRLRDCIRCECTEERNGIYEVEFEYPITGAHYSDIRLGRIIVVEHDESGDVQPFDIYLYSRPIDGVVTFHACHISYRQRGLTVQPGANTLKTAFNALKVLSAPENPFNYSTDMAFSDSVIVPAFSNVPMTVKELLGGVEGSILDVAGGEYEWDKFNVRLWRARGVERDFYVRYGVNMSDYSEEMDISESINALRVYWEKDEQVAIGPMVTLGTRPDGRIFCRPFSVSDKFETLPTVTQMRAAAIEYMSANQTYLPKQTIKVDFVRLQDTPEYEQFTNLFTCNLCDTIKVIFPGYGVEGRFKIVKVVWDVLLERYSEMELGTLSTTLSEALGISSSSGGSGSASTNTIETGTITGSSVSANSYKDYTVTFNKSFASVPIVTASFQSTSTAGAFGNCTLGIVSTSLTGFTVRVFNGDASGRAPNINWIAVGA